MIAATGKKHRHKPGTYHLMPHKLFELNLTWKAILAYNAIAHHCDANNTCFPSLSTMGEVVGIHRNTIRDGVAELVRAGVVFTVRRGKAGAQWSNKYMIQPISRWGKPVVKSHAKSSRVKEQVSGVSVPQDDEDWTLPEYCGLLGRQERTWEEDAPWGG